MPQAIEFVHPADHQRLPKPPRRFEEASDDLIRDLRQAQTPEAVFDMVASCLMDPMPYDRLGLALLSADGQEVRGFRVHSRLPVRYGQYDRRRLIGSSMEPLLREGAIRIIRDLQDYLQFKPSSWPTKRLIEEGMRSSLTLPLYSQGRPLGFLFFTSMHPDGFSLVHASMAARVAPVIGQALGRTLEGLDLDSLNPGLPTEETDYSEEGIGSM